MPWWREEGEHLTDSERAPRFPSRQHVTLWAAVLFAVSGSGCTRHLGPRAVKWERTHYNLAIQETDDTQLLLNLVRLKYRDTPVFLGLNGIVSQELWKRLRLAPEKVHYPVTYQLVEHAGERELDH